MSQSSIKRCVVIWCNRRFKPKRSNQLTCCDVCSWERKKWRDQMYRLRMKARLKVAEEVLAELEAWFRHGEGLHPDMAPPPTGQPN